MEPPNINPIGVQAQLDGNSGTELPTDLQKLYAGFVFHLTGTGKNKVYLVKSKMSTPNPFEECIEIRKGNYKWVELIHDNETDTASMGDEVLVECKPIEYLTTVMYDMTDVINAIYLNFSIYDKKTTEFMKLIGTITNTQMFVDSIEAFTSLKLPHTRVDMIVTTDNMNIMFNAIKTILYISYMNSIK
jgi:hypothetical protein